MRILYLLPVPSQVRYQKRVYSLEKQGVKSCVMAFERNYYQGKPWKDGYVSLGELEHQNYLSRMFPFIKAIKKIRLQLIDFNPHVIYGFGLDMVFLGWISSIGFNRNLKIVYEVGDIRNVQIGKSILSYFVRAIERIILSQIRVLVATSKGYIDEYYSKIFDIDSVNCQIIENKLLRDSFNLTRIQEKNINDNLIIGYYGVIRGLKTWEALKSIVKSSSRRINIYLWGIPLGIDSFIDDINKFDNFQFEGSYIFPDDLPKIYNRVDLIWACHFFQESRSNRFYEACFFRKPLIAQKGTLDGYFVKKFNIGLCIDLNDIKDTVEKIQSINKEKIDRWIINLESLPEDIYTYTDEHRELVKALE